MKFIFTTFLFMLTSLSFAQLMEDKAAQKIVEKALDRHYNNDDSGAKVEIKKLKEGYSQHPIYPLLSSMLLLDELKEEGIAKRYLAYLDLAEVLSNTILEKNEFPIEGMFFLMTAHSYKALYYSEQGNYFKAVGEAQRTYKYIKKAYDLTDQFPEFLLSVGLYNYYREQYPETHPAVKPLIGLFKNGNKALGLKQLEKCVETTTFTRPEALSYITHIYLKYESNYKRGLKYAQIAFNDFYENPYFRSRYAEGLLKNNKESKALNQIEVLKKDPDILYQTIGLVFEGYYYEIMEKDDEKASKAYALALKNYKENKKIDQEYICWSHVGLARIMGRKGKKEAAEEFYKKALNGEYESIRKEARIYLKSH